MTGRSAVDVGLPVSQEHRRVVCAVGYLSRAAFELALARLRFASQDSAALLQSFTARGGNGASAPVEVAEIAWIGWSIAAVARRVPWRSDCLIQALAADRWLRRLGSSPELVLDVVKDRSGILAHARLTCDGIAVVGGSGVGWTPVFGGR